MDEPLLETRDLDKRFHALVAVNAVSLRVARGEVHAIIGPNGAGKTTLINLLSGDLAPSGGRVLFKGRDITGLSSDRISRLGISRSYQRTNIFPTLTCFENCWLAAQSRLKSSMRFVMPASRRHDVRLRTEGALEVCGLSERAGLIASALSHGEQRQLELGMVLATEPELLLLDEPLAGMGSEEAAEIIELLRRLARSHTIVLIEHDMDAVFAIASRITVMVNGEVLTTGSVDEVRQNRAVQEAYLGTDDGLE
jgi:branched-chain amino acid transport system ATP-binding protein